MIRFLLILLVSLQSVMALANTSGIINELSAIPKSPNDQRDYLAITLSNKLDVLLISDPSSDKASAALDVHVGSADDPDAFLGLAHFLEHMLFLGTKKYPTPDEYQKFISDHGGSHNAFTAFDHTNYFFDIQSGFLEEALDRFSQQFTSPLFNEDYVQREVNAVHSEFTSKIKDDGRRFFSAIKQTLSANHPYSKFSVGNLQTLKDLPEKTLRQALLDFYDAHYSANRMRLVILGKEPLSTLKTWAISKFSDIPNKNLPEKILDQPFFDAGALPLQLNVQTIMDKRSLTVAFPVPSASNHKDSQPLSYLSNLIGHEGKGSLLSKLKALDLVDGLSAGDEFDTETQTMLMINMSLTQKGLDNYSQILDVMFDYFALLKKDGIQALYFDEQAKLLDIAFKFQEKSEPIHYTSALAMALHESPANKVLVEAYQLNNYQPELYKQYLDLLTPQNMLIAISAQNVEVNEKTQWYDAPYKLSKLPEEMVNTLAKVDSRPALHMPAANEFIPDDTAMLGNKSLKPEALLRTEGFDVWYAFDASFGTPKATIFLTLRSPVSNVSAASQNATDLLVSLLKDSLNEFSYPAYLAGLNFELYQHMRGLTVKISGYNDKQSNLLIKIMNSIKHAQFSNDRFEIIKERLKRELENAKDRKPFEQAISKAQNILIQPSWTEQERLNALATQDLNEINLHRDAFLKELEAVLFVSGNITQAGTLNIANQIKAMLLKDSRAVNVERSNIAKLSGEKTFISPVKVDHTDTGFVYYLQGKEKSVIEQAKLLLLNQAISTDYYATIRTDKQLGYIVFAINFDLLDVPALAFVVQSPVAKGDQLLKESQAFIDTQLEQIAKLSDGDLSRYKASVISKLLKQDNTLYGRAGKYWQDVDRENYEFDTDEDIANAVNNLSKKDLLETLQALKDNPGRSLVIYTHSGDETISPESLNLSPIPETGFGHF